MYIYIYMYVTIHILVCMCACVCWGWEGFSWGRCVLLQVHLVFSTGPGGDASSNGVQNGGLIFAASS